jgi:hypothetical protein
MTERYELEDASGTLLLENGSDNYRLDFPIFTVDENVAVQESSNKLKTIIQNVSSTLGLTEVSEYFKGLVKVATQFIVSAEETSAKKLRDLTYLIEGTNDSYELEDGSGLYRLDYPLKVDNATVGLEETAERYTGLIKIISSTILFTDVGINYVKGFVKTVTSALVTLEDVVNTIITEVNLYLLEDGSGRYKTEEGDYYLLDQLLIVKNALSTVGLTELSQKVNGILHNIADLVRLEEASNRLGTIKRNILSTVGLTESKNLGYRITTALNTVGLNEASNRLGGLIRNVLSTVGINELSNYVRGLSKTILSTLGFTEQTNTISGIVQVVSSTLGLEELTNRIRTVIIDYSLGDFVATALINLNSFIVTSLEDVNDFTVVDSLNSGDFIISDDV